MRQLRLRWSVVTVVAVLMACAGTHRGFSQATNTGTVVGEVTDPSGALIRGAAVTLADASAGVKLTAVTNTDGKYAFTVVPPGTYSVVVSKSGFSTSKAEGQVVNVGTQLTIDMKLKVGGASETVEVQVMGTELQTLNSTVGETISQEAINSLPSLGHDATTFVELQPGVSPDGSVAGAVSDQSTWLLDGGNNSSDMDGNNTVYNTTAAFAGDPTGGAGSNTTSYDLTAPPSGIMPTPADSVEEVKVNTANQTADFDNSSGAQVEFVTPRGTNRWHGGVYEYYLDNGFDANTWDNNQTDTPLTQYHYSRFGAKAGGFLTPQKWGGRFYLFGFFEGYRYPQSATVTRIVPSATLRQGTIIENGTPYPMASVDPRGIGIDPTVAAMWSKYEPAGNVPGTPTQQCASLAGTYCDGYNEVAFKANMSLPLTSNDMVFRMDHDFSSKLHWFTSYRYFKLTQAVNKQYDIGGFFSGDKLGVPASTANRPLVPWYFVTGLTTSITSNTTNDFHYSYLRNYWSWSTQNGPPQISGLGGAMEPFGESASTVLAPFNVDTQDVRTRFWDGHDNFLSDNVSILKGNHLLQFGGQYQHNWDYHQRSDNGGGINFTATYQLGEQSAGAGSVDMTDLGGGFPLNKNSERLASAVLGIVTQSQVAYTRSGTNLTLNPPLTHAFDQDSIPFYNAYFSDTWHMKPSFTLTMGLGYTLEMPPTEVSGKQTVLVDAADEPVQTEDYIKQRQAAALQGSVYNPEVGFALVHNVGSGLKYPYQPFYGSFSPRVGVAWNPGFSKATVIRGGYGRIYGRLNGVDLVLSPLLGIGLIQAVACDQTFMNGSCGPNNPTAGNAFRIGVDGNSAPLPAAAPSLPQPAFPG
ncbi:MAG: carboxypeptidase-like regulatory domain-containing protein, partial [Acidobacteriaceae bacterium]